MSKKIIVAALLLVAVAVVFSACKKDDYEVSYTVPVEDGEAITVYKDNEGNEFVTNVDGDKIPVTTDKDGFYDDITSLVTETTTKKQDNTTTTTTKQDKDNTTTTTTNPDKDNTTTTTNPDKDDTTTTTGAQVIIGEGSGKQDSVDWKDIVNA